MVAHLHGDCSEDVASTTVARFRSSRRSGPQQLFKYLIPQLNLHLKLSRPWRTGALLCLGTILLQIQSAAQRAWVSITGPNSFLFREPGRSYSQLHLAGDAP